MTKKITHSDITITRLHNGAIECYATVDNHFTTIVYYGYTKREAQQAFYNTINGK